jgi:hypothetical protein
MRTSILALALLQSACYSEDWIIHDQRGLGAANFWATVVNGQGQPLTFISHYPLNPAGRTQLNLSSPIPVIELKDLEVTAWVDATGTNECLEECHPHDGDPVVKLSDRNWPFVYEIVFPPMQ